MKYWRLGFFLYFSSFQALLDCSRILPFFTIYIRLKKTLESSRCCRTISVAILSKVDSVLNLLTYEELNVSYLPDQCDFKAHWTALLIFYFAYLFFLNKEIVTSRWQDLNQLVEVSIAILPKICGYSCPRASFLFPASVWKMSVNEQNVKKQIKGGGETMPLRCSHYLNLLPISSFDSHWECEFPCSCTNWFSKYWQEGLEGECNTRYVAYEEKKNDVYLYDKFRDLNNCKQKVMLNVGIPYLQLFQPLNCLQVRGLFIFLTCGCGSLSFNGGLSFCKLQIWDPELGHKGRWVPHFSLVTVLIWTWTCELCLFLLFRGRNLFKAHLPMSPKWSMTVKEIWSLKSRLNKYMSFH